MLKQGKQYMIDVWGVKEKKRVRREDQIKLKGDHIAVLAHMVLDGDRLIASRVIDSWDGSYRRLNTTMFTNLEGKSWQEKVLYASRTDTFIATGVTSDGKYVYGTISSIENPTGKAKGWEINNPSNVLFEFYPYGDGFVPQQAFVNQNMKTVAVLSNPDDEYDYRSEISVFDIKSSRIIFQQNYTEDQNVNLFGFMPNSDDIIVFLDGKILFIDYNNGKIVHTIDSKNDGILFLAFSEDKKFLAIAFSNEEDYEYVDFLIYQYQS